MMSGFQIVFFCHYLGLGGDCGVDHPGSSTLKPTADGPGKVNRIENIQSCHDDDDDDNDDDDADGTGKVKNRIENIQSCHDKLEDDRFFLSRESENSEDVSLKKQVQLPTCFAHSYICPFQV